MNRIPTLVGLAACVCTFALPAIAGPAGHAPIGVMGDHVHQAGEWMVSYRYGRMHMDGNRSGTSNDSLGEVLADFLATPTQMDTQMHMWGLMYAPHDRVTLMAMVPYVRKDMDHVNRAGVPFTTRSAGFGDITLSAIVRALDIGHHQLLLNLGLSFPSGSISQKDNIPVMGRVPLPYPMQIGSGSYDPRLGFTYNGHMDRIRWGAQAMGIFRTAENRRDYRLGHEYDVSAWGAYEFAQWVSTSARLRWSGRGNIDGADPRLNPAMIPTADPRRRGGDQLDILFGINLLMPSGAFEGHRLAFEFGVPMYRRLDGPQLERDYNLVVGWQKAF